MKNTVQTHHGHPVHPVKEPHRLFDISRDVGYQISTRLKSGANLIFHGNYQRTRFFRVFRVFRGLKS